MVLSFFRRGDDTLEHIEHEIVAMLNHCRHSFDLAMGALVTDADIVPIGEEVRATDRQVNAIEEKVRRELVVHVSVQGGADVAAVLTSLLIVKKLERVGDQTKNVFDLADEGVRFSGAPDYERFVELRQTVSGMIGEAATILAERDLAAVADFTSRADAFMNETDALVNSFIHSDEPASYAVPRAMLVRYLKRIVANLSGSLVPLVEGIDRTNPDADLDE